MHKKIRSLFAIILILAVGACAKPLAEAPTEAPNTTLQLPTETLLPTVTLTPTLAPTATPTTLPTLTQTPMITVTPFPGFSDRFKFYQAWTKNETTYFYFMNAQVDQTI